MMTKRILVPERIRQPPREGWSWIDRRFLRDHASALSQEAMLLYFFLAAVSDKHGLSFWSDASMAVRLRLSEQAVARAREELLARDLVAHQAPLTQVLTLPQAMTLRGGGPQVLGDILRQWAAGDWARTERHRRTS